VGKVQLDLGNHFLQKDPDHLRIRFDDALPQAAQLLFHSVQCPLQVRLIDARPPDAH
jgi:hypothetical protein